MIDHAGLGADAATRQRQLRRLITAGRIRLGGHKVLKIYGTLACASGKRMKVENRVFFTTEEEAVAAGYRPCGHCLRRRYRAWKARHA